MPPASSNYPLPPKNSKTTLVSVVLAGLLIISLVGNVWLFLSSQNSKDTDTKISTAVATAKAQQAAIDKQQADALAKAPYKTFQGSPTYGSVTFDYPKSYSVYTDQSQEPLNAYFHPDQVPSTQSNTSYALRVELVNTGYSEVVGGFESQIAEGTVKASAYVPPKMKTAANVSPGMLLSGPISSQNDKASGTMLVIKVRDKTLKIYTESTNFNSDFNDIVLPSLTFSP